MCVVVIVLSVFCSLRMHGVKAQNRHIPLKDIFGEGTGCPCLSRVTFSLMVTLICFTQSLQ